MKQSVTWIFKCNVKEDKADANRASCTLLMTDRHSAI